MTSLSKGVTTQHVYINILARTKSETEACMDDLFPGQAGKHGGARNYHVIREARTGREAEENEEPRMKTLKGDLGSTGSSMETDSLPGYDDLCPDGGGDGLRPHNGCSADADGDQRMATMKSTKQEQRPAESSWSSSMPSTSTFSYDHTWSTGSYEVGRQYRVYEIPWERDRGLLWCTMPISQSVFVLVVDMDNTHPEITDDYVDMVRCIDDLCKHKSVFEDNEKPTLFLVGRSQKSGKDSFNNFLKSISPLRSELTRHIHRCRFDVGDFLMMEGLTEPLQRLRQSLHLIPTNAMGQSIPLVSDICRIVSECSSCSLDVSTMMQRIGYSDRNNFVSTLKYLQSGGAIVYVDCEDSVWTKPDLLMEACADLQTLECNQLTKSVVIARCTDTLNVTKADASACIAALESLCILTEISEPTGANNYTQAHGNKASTSHRSSSHYLFSLHLKPGKDFFQTIKPKQVTHTPVLRISLSERQPHYVCCNMLQLLLQKHWQPVQQGTNVLLNHLSAAFKFPHKTNPGSERAYLTTDRKSVYVTVVSFKQTSLDFDPSKCAKLRDDVESALSSATQSLEPSCRMSCAIRCTDTEGALTGTDGWIEVGCLQAMVDNGGDTGVCDQHQNWDRPHEIKPSQLLQAWYPDEQKCTSLSNGFSAQSSTMEFEPSAKPKNDMPLKDGLLSKISKCFGQGWDMFFVENDLDQSDVDKAKANNPGQMSKQVYDCLRCWKDDLVKREKAPTVKLLRTRMKKCDQLTVNWEKFDEIANED